MFAGRFSERPDLLRLARLRVRHPADYPSTSEGLSPGLLFVVVNPIPGQEERHANHFLKEGAAIRCNNLPVPACRVDWLLDDPGRLESMRAAALKVSHPRAAHHIAAELEQLGAGPSARSLPFRPSRFRTLLVR
ncbi:MAG TPA: hypothetical protein V6D08_01180 [Candidatus Obscuribacterales bacterium]